MSQALRGDVRLTGAASVGALVEVYTGATWDSLCGQGWDLAAGKVVCTQAGYLDVFQVGRNVTDRQVRSYIWENLLMIKYNVMSLKDWCKTF